MTNTGKGLILFFTTAYLLATDCCYAQIKEIDIVKADSIMHKNAKPLLVLISAEWCKFCDIQKNQLRKNKDFIEGMAGFHYAEFNAESKKSVRFGEKEYHFNASGGIHELAIALNGSPQLAFPTWVLLDKDLRVLFRYGGVLNPAQLKDLLKAIRTMN